MRGGHCGVQWGRSGGCSITVLGPPCFYNLRKAAVTRSPFSFRCLFRTDLINICTNIMDSWE